jgi:hypothetical protein
MRTLDAFRFTDDTIMLLATGAEPPAISHAGEPVRFVPARIDGNPWCAHMAITNIPHPDPNCWQASIDCGLAATEAELLVDGKPARVRWSAPSSAPAPKPARRSRSRRTDAQ